MNIRKFIIVKVVPAIMLAFLICAGHGITVHAAVVPQNAVETRVEMYSPERNAVETPGNVSQMQSYAFEHVQINTFQPYSNKKASSHIHFEEGSDPSNSGVTELDDSLTRGKKFLVGIIHFFGAAVALFGVVFAAIGFLGRDNEQKIIGITAFIVGVAIFFAPQIVNAVVGQSVF